MCGQKLCKQKPLVICVTCNPFPHFSICSKLRDIFIRTLPSSNLLMVRAGLWIFFLLLLIAKKRYQWNVNQFYQDYENK